MILQTGGLENWRIIEISYMLCTNQVVYSTSYNIIHILVFSIQPLIKKKKKKKS